MSLKSAKANRQQANGETHPSSGVSVPTGVCVCVIVTPLDLRPPKQSQSGDALARTINVGSYCRFIKILLLRMVLW